MSNNTNKQGAMKGLMSLIAFIAVFCIGVSLLIGLLPLKGIASAFSQVAQILAYIITAVIAFNFVKTKKHWAIWTIWAVSVVLIVVVMIVQIV
jgi:hypothetical protein